MSKLLANLTATVLVTVYNNLAATIDAADVKKFPNKEKAVERVTKMLERVNTKRVEDNLPLVGIAEDGKLFSVEPPKQEASVESQETKAPKAPKTPKVVKKSPGRVAAVGPSDVIILKAAENPKRAEAAARFAKYATGITVADYFERVGDKKQALRDLNWDIKKGWVEVVGPKSAAAKAAKAPKVEAVEPKTDEVPEALAPPVAPAPEVSATA